ncbi:putative nuclease HARBI1 [Episyrphus balteatus]|uniref:putative nuclease HARBI1 n=1 Tax=Episyrphus balteatus TaxID=286459 RepID=UPI002484E3FB|nr:putative nuclease HARBI1 [Episyrphus balteatus]
MSVMSVQYLLERLGPSIAHPTNCNEALTPLQQILLTLHWLGSGCQYHGVGSMHGVSKSSICRCVNRVCTYISQQLLGEEVVWPQNANAVAEGFFAIAGMPRIAGAIDGTLIPIEAPSVNEESFVDRKGLHSINVMLVAGADYRFYAINSNFPGSVHDSRVLQCSHMYNKWQNELWRPFPGAIVIGDSAYPLKKWLFTPNIPASIGEGRAANIFLAKLKKTRQVVECSLGQLKEIFPCLNGLRLKTPISCAIVINACVTLYNIRKRMSPEINSVFQNDDNDVEDLEIHEDHNANDAVEDLRSYINFFN